MTGVVPANWDDVIWEDEPLDIELQNQFFQELDRSVQLASDSNLRPSGVQQMVIRKELALKKIEENLRANANQKCQYLTWPVYDNDDQTMIEQFIKQAYWRRTDNLRNSLGVFLKDDQLADEVFQMIGQVLKEQKLE